MLDWYLTDMTWIMGSTAPIQTFRGMFSLHTTPENLHINSKEELNARTLDIKKTDWSTF